MNGRSYSAGELEQLAELYPHRHTKEVAKALGRGINSVYNAAHKLGLKKTTEFLGSEESGMLRKGETRPESIPYQFKKGQIPFNKGLRRPGWHQGRMKETQFKKGHRTGVAAQNWKPIGTILADSDGFLRIKVREAVHGHEPTGFGNAKVWTQLNRYLWEQAHGPIPPKHIVKFKDGDRSNCVLENLELISMADNCRRNSMWASLPRELAEVVHLQGQLKRIIRNRNDRKGAQ